MDDPDVNVLKQCLIFFVIIFMSCEIIGFHIFVIIIIVIILEIIFLFLFLSDFVFVYYLTYF